MAMRSENACGCLSQAILEERICLCPTKDIVQVIGRRHAISLINIIGNRGKIRFNELKEKLGRISSSTLAMRLEELTEAGLIERTVYPETPPRVEYGLTTEGEQLRRMLTTLRG